MLRSLLWTLSGTLLFVSALLAADANRLTYLDEFCDPYYPHGGFAKLTTPQWVGEKDVECVVVLAIDDMRDPAKYEAYLRPILDRLKQIDGRAPVSIMTNQVDPQDERLQGWLKEGLSLEVHTFDHPCPCLQGGDFAKAKGTYDKCVDLLNQVPNNKPVAFRMPCCDSLNTPSPRFWVEMFNKTTPAGNYLTIDSSVFNIITGKDASLPKEITHNEQGEERFRRYLPFPSFVNTIEDYPYPYVIAGKCWQFPCVVPSDWSAQHVQKPNNPNTVRDFKLALDACVLKQGVYNLVFHPHGWIRNDQIVELIDHAVAKHGKKVKFLTFKECDERLTKNLLRGHPLRNEQGHDNGVRILDANGDGYMDVVIGTRTIVNDAGLLAMKPGQTRIWDATSQSWLSGEFPEQFDASGPRFGVLLADGRASMLGRGGTVWHLVGADWQAVPESDRQVIITTKNDKGPSSLDHGVRLRDFDGDGVCECIDDHGRVHAWNLKDRSWVATGATLPPGLTISYSGDRDIQAILQQGKRDGGLRFVDLDGDRDHDIVFANENLQGVWLFDSLKTGWKRVQHPAEFTLPLIARDGRNNGAWFHSQHLWFQNEDTNRLPDHVDRRAFAQLLGSQKPAKEAAAKPVEQPAPASEPRPIVITPTDRKSAAGQEATDERIKELGVAKTPQEALATMVVKEGFKLELVAAEPLIVDPVAFDWGPDGRLWVVEMRDYPRGIDEKGKPGGRVKVLTDEDGDGKFDKAQVFVDDLPFPTGIKVWRRGVLITAAPDIIYAEDTTGDDIADVNTTLCRGFGEGNQQHRVNGLRWGLDNWIYVGNGDSGGTVQSLKTQERVRISGRDLRIRPDTGELDAVSGQTQFSLCFDDVGNRFGGNNSQPLWHYVLEDFHLRRTESLLPPPVRQNVPTVPGNAPIFPASKTPTRFNDYHTANRFTSACGVEIYRDTYLGDAYYGNSLVCEPVHNLVHREVLEPQGMSFRSDRPADEQQSEFLASSDPWFRPVMARTGPDGALYVADMYRQVIEHPTWIPTDWQRKLDMRVGSDRGRIYRLVRKEEPPRKLQPLDKLSTQDLVAELNNPSGTRRDLVQQMIVWRGDQEAATPLANLATKAMLPQVRWQALCTLEGLNALTPESIAAALQNENAGVRYHGARLAETLLQEHPELGQELAKLAEDPDLRVKWQLAWTLGAWDDPTGGEVLAKLAAEHGSDPYFALAILGSLRDVHRADFLVKCLQRREAFDAWFESSLTQAIENREYATIKRLVRELDNRIETDRVLAFRALETILAKLERQPWPNARFVDERGALVMHKLFNLAEKLLQDKEAKPDERFAAAKLLGQQFAASRTIGRPTYYVTLQKIAEDEQTAEALRTVALKSLAISPDVELPSWERIFSPQAPLALQEAYLAAFTQRQRIEELARLLADWRSRTPTQRTKILDALLAAPEGCEALLSAISRQQILPQQLDAARRTRLLEHPEEHIRKRALHVLRDVTDLDRAKVLASFSDLLDKPGDAMRGKAVFTKRCSQCHRHGGVGHAVGPELASLTDKSPQAFLTALLDPNRAVEDKFQSYLLVTTDGRIITGIITSETGTSITLIEPEGRTQDILRKEIDTLYSSGKSLMPEGLERDMPKQEFADVIAYLRAAPPKTFAGNEPALVKPEADGKLLLKAAQASIHGPTLVFEAKYQNLGFWQSEDDYAAWSVEVPRAGKYRVTLDYACDESTAGDRFTLTIGDQLLSGKVASTGTWDDYREVDMGEVELRAGTHEAVFRSLGGIRSALLDLRTIRLAPGP